MDHQNRTGQPDLTAESMDSLRLTNRQQQTALRAKGRLIDNMAYQIRTLSNAIIGFSDLLLTEELTDDQHEYAVEINQAGKGLSELVNEVLDWACLESGRLRIVRTPCQISDLMDRLEQIIRPIAAEKKLALNIHIDPNLPQSVVTDGDRLLKCLLNLSANAVQYTPQGQIALRVMPEQRHNTEYIRFDVTDSGQGISPEKLSRLFEPAEDVENAHTEVVSMLNLGLSVTAGLPLTRQLAELLGGTLEAQSQPGTGSTFSLLIPVDRNLCVETGSATELPARAKPQARDDKPLPILVVEDQESNRTVIRLLLNAMGYEAQTAVDGQEAVELASSNRFSLVIMDLKMPRMDGYEAARCLRSRQFDAPIIALSALTLTPEEKDRIASLFDGFLCKPVDSEQLLATVVRYTGQTARRASHTGVPV